MATLNPEALEKITVRIENAPNGKRRGHGAAFRANDRAGYLAKGEKMVGIVGGFAYSAIFSPAGARGSYRQDMVLFYGAAAVLVHEAPAEGPVLDWFNRVYERAA